jgi:hypothetical protein
VITREQIERLGAEGGGLGRQEVTELLELYDAWAAFARRTPNGPAGDRGQGGGPERER